MACNFQVQGVQLVPQPDDSKLGAKVYVAWMGHHFLILWSQISWLVNDP
jgi:hypothetical protein